MGILEWLRCYHKCGTFHAIPPPSLSPGTGESQKAKIVLSTVCIYRFCMHGPSVAEGIIVFTRYFLNCSNKNLPKSGFLLATDTLFRKS